MKPEKGKKREGVPVQRKKEATPQSGSFLSGVFLNVTGAGIAIIFIYFLFAPWTAGMEDAEAAKVLETTRPNIDGYYWLYNTMLSGNLKTINNNPDLTIAQRYQIKSGEIGYIYRIKELTPDSAIIIIPPKQLLLKVGFKSAVELPWLTYFVYPRKVVYEDDKDSSKLYQQATYILALNGWGLNKLNYRVDRPESFMVLPLKK